MFCLSDLLSQVHLEHSTNPSTKDETLSICTQQLLPELIYADISAYQELLTSITPSIAPLCDTPAKLRLSVESVKSSADLCLVQSNFSFKSRFTEAEITQRLGKQFQLANEMGAWVEVSEYFQSMKTLSIELSLRGNVPII